MHYRLDNKLIILEDIYDIFKKSPAFSSHPSSPRHFASKDGKWMFYINEDMHYEYIKICIMDWTLKSRPLVSLEDFLNRADPEVSKTILWHLDLFPSPTK